MNQAKEQYIALLNQDDVPEHHLESALLRRAMECVRRLLVLQQEKPALHELLRKGHIGDDVWRDFEVAEQDIRQEVQTIAAEAATFKADWNKTIFQTASQMVEAEKQKDAQAQMADIKEREQKRQAMEKLQHEQQQQLETKKSNDS